MGIIKNQNQGNVNYDHSKASLDAKVKAGNFRELHSDVEVIFFLVLKSV